ncbi:MAG: rhodanese-like domain-containing protein [Myxococcota bacterium]
MKRFALCFVLMLLAPVTGFADPSDPDLAPSISPETLQAEREAGNAPVVVDVRTPAEFAQGHIPGAVNISWDEPEKIAALDAPHGVALYCMVGPRARKGEAKLLEKGVNGVLHIEGGLAAWKDAGLPVDVAP